MTELTKHKAITSNMSKNANELQELMVGMSTGRRINKPSDDPVGAARVQDFKTSINHSKTLERNLGADKMWLTLSEDILKQMGGVVQHVKELALEGGNPTSTKEFRQNVAVELEAITRDLVELANKKEGKLHLFSGTKTFTEPLKINGDNVEVEIFLDDDTLKSRTQTIPVKQNEPIENMESGSFYIVLHDQNAEQVSEDGQPIPPSKLRVDVEEDDSLNMVLEKINQAAIKDGDFTPSEFSPLGYETRMMAEIDSKNRVSLEPTNGVTLQFERIPNEDPRGFFSSLFFGDEEPGNDFLKIMGFETTDSDKVDDGALPSRFKANPEDFGAKWVGYSNNEYLVRVTKGGGFGKAQFIVSENNGKDWSQPQMIQRKTEIFNPEGRASDHLMLQFDAGTNPFFKEGMDLIFKGNTYVEYQGNDQPKEVLIDNGIKVALNLTARDLFYKNPEDADTVNLFDVIHRLTVALGVDDPKAVLKSIGDIDTSLNQLLKGRAQMGALMKELEDSGERITRNMDYKAEELSKIEDRDMAKAAIELNTAEMKNRTSLDAAARLIQPSLVNFLK
ncbi:MAG: hypothetical protein GY786_11825 [Proteobacteria bacterium]|nr:hypothetical protein [Pseudomonadota bacterium]